MVTLQWVFWIVGAVLQVLVLASLLRGPYKRYPFLTVYMTVLILTTVIEVAALIDTGYIESTRRYFWISDSVKRFLLFCIVFGFIHQAGRGSESRGRIERLLIIGAALVTAVSFLIHRQLSVSFMMTNVGRDLSFFSAVLNLVLWSLLIRSRDRDRQLLMVTGGLGIQFTGEAIGHSLRHISPATVAVGNIVLASGHILCLYFWWEALRKTSPKS